MIDVRCPWRGSGATERGEGVGGGYHPPTVGTFSKNESINSRLRAFKDSIFLQN